MSFDIQRNMLRRMAWRMEDLGRDVAESEHVAVVDASKRRSRFRTGEQHILGARGLGQTPSRRGMVGMNMRVDDVDNSHPRDLRRLEIGRDIADGVDDGGCSLSPAAKQVRDRDGIGVQELS